MPVTIPYLTSGFHSFTRSVFIQLGTCFSSIWAQAYAGVSSSAFSVLHPESLLRLETFILLKSFHCLFYIQAAFLNQEITGKVCCNLLY